MKKYCSQNLMLARTSAQYLEALAAQIYTDRHNIRRFLHTFTYLSTKTVEKGNIAPNQVKKLLLQSCNEQYAEKILQTLKITDTSQFSKVTYENLAEETVQAVSAQRDTGETSLERVLSKLCSIFLPPLSRRR